MSKTRAKSGLSERPKSSKMSMNKEDGKKTQKIYLNRLGDDDDDWLEETAEEPWPGDEDGDSWMEEDGEDDWDEDEDKDVDVDEWIDEEDDKDL